MHTTGQARRDDNGFDGMRDAAFMRLAIEQACRAASIGEVPIGAVVVCEGEVVAVAHNRREADADPSAHAEFRALVEASRRLGRWRLTGCTVYVTLEPCLMCAGLMQLARVDRCVFGAADPKGGALGSLYEIHRDERLNHRFEVTGGVCERECAELLSGFFARLRAGKPGEPIGAGAAVAADGGAGAIAAADDRAATEPSASQPPVPQPSATGQGRP